MKVRRNSVWRSTIAYIVAVMMLIGTTPAVFADTANASDDTYNYVSIGASQTNGYGMRGYLDAAAYEDPASFDKDTANVYGYQRAPEGAYPYKLSKYLEETTGKNVKLDQLAMSSMRAEEVRMLLDESYSGDAYTKWRFSDGHKWFDRAGGLDKLRADYKNAITDADLITLEVGVNNFGVYAINQLTSGGEMFETNLADVFTEEELAMYKSAKDKISQMVKSEMDYSSTSTVDLIIDTFAYAYMGFTTNFDEIIKKINELNPDADIVVLGIPNMLSGIEAEVPGVEGTVPLGDVFGGVVKLANLYTKTLADNRDTFMYAEAGDNMKVETFLDEILAYNGDPATLSINMKDCFDIYDDDLKLRTKVEDMLKGQDQAVIDKALETAYDIVAEIMHEGAMCDEIDLKTLMTGDISAAENKALKYIEESVTAGVNAVVQGQEYDFQFDKSLMDDPEMATVFCIGVRSSIGNSFFAHPNEAGHDEVKAAIAAAIEKGETAKDETNKLITFEYEVSEDSYYVALGDGTVMGDESYAAKIKDALGLKEVQFNNLGNEETTAENIIDTIETNKADIAKADLITLGFGNGQFVEVMGDSINETLDEEINWAKYVGDKYAGRIEATLADLQTKLSAEMNEEFAAILIDAVEGYGYAYASFTANYPKAAAKIREINPDAKVIIVGMYNPLKGLAINTGDQVIAVGDYIEYIVKLTNLHYKTYVLSAKNAVYVEAADVETVKTYDSAEPIKLGGFLTIFRSPEDMYPNDNGHEYIKTQIMSAMKPVTPDVPDAPEDSDTHVHSYGDWIIDKEATCIEEGKKHKACSCGSIVEESIGLADHTVVIDKAVEPTYTETGLTEGSHCAVCNEIIEAQQIVETKVYSAAPASVAVTLSTAKNGYDNVKFSWSKVADAEGYKVFYKRASSTKWSSVTVKGKTYYVTKDLTDGVKYDFRVRPYVVDGDKEVRSTKYKGTSIYTLKKVSTPKVGKSGTKVKVRWSNINGESGYQISKSTKKTGINVVYTYKTTKGTYKTLTAKKKTKYYYRVRAYKSVKVGSKYVKVYGPWSAPKSYKR